MGAEAVGRSRCLGFVVVAGLAGAHVNAQQPPSTPRFEVASIRPCEPRRELPVRRGLYNAGGGYVAPTPGRLNVECVPLIFLIADAYIRSANAVIRPVEIVPISGGPSWINSERYDIEARAQGNPSAQTMEGPMLQALLEDRFNLKIHR